jgi:hypothetical protein
MVWVVVGQRTASDDEEDWQKVEAVMVMLAQVALLPWAVVRTEFAVAEVVRLVQWAEIQNRWLPNC